MNVTVIGTGYVGLVTGACLADAGNNVFCLDVDERKIARLNRGEIPIFEPGLKAIVKRNEAADRLRFSADVAASVAHGDIQLIAVGTPRLARTARRTSNTCWGRRAISAATWRATRSW